MEKAGAFWLRPFRLQKKLFDDRWSDVETIDRDNRLNTGKIRLAYADGDGALFGDMELLSKPYRREDLAAALRATFVG